MSAASSDRRDESDEEDERPSFECNICFDTAKDAVVSQCGHLFCWPCLHQWLETKPMNPQCPVCKSAISKDKVTPIYGKGGSTTDPRSKAPPRPRGQREEARGGNFGGFQGFQGFGGPVGGFQMSFGIGAFPFGLFTTWNSNDGERAPTNPAAGTAPIPQRDEDFLTQIFIGLAVIFFLLMLFV